MPIVLYGCETWYLTLREEYRLRVFKHRVLRGIRVCGPNREEVTESSRKLRNEELRDWYSLPNIIRVIRSKNIRRVGNVARKGETRNAYRFFVGKPKGERHHSQDLSFARVIIKWILIK
jgi:hypothetical protein